jgi:Flp pilus assembly protein CpaB
VSRRARAAAFTATAAVCAALAAASAGGQGGDPGFGSLRDVVVATRTLPARHALERDRIDDSLAIRRIPSSFTAPDALSNPAQALGRRPAATIPAGSYLVGSQLLAPRSVGTSATPPAAELDAGRRPVEITVNAAGPLASEIRSRVDVVVTTEPSTGPGGPGRTYVAARGVELLDLAAAGEDSSAPPDPLGAQRSVATLALTRSQALRLIHAQSFAREVRLIGS